MCRLVGWVSDEPRTLAEVLGADGLAELTELSRHHADGWGMAWWEADGLQVRTSHLPAHSSPHYPALTREVRSDAALLHLRWATPGIRVAPENTHPFALDDRAFGHNGAVRPADGLLPLLTPRQIDTLGGDTDSERLLHVLLDRIDAHGLEDGLRSTVRDVCRDLTPSSLNMLLLGSSELTALCCHGAFALGEGPETDGPPEDQPGYFDLRWRREGGAVVLASQPLGVRDWSRLPNGTGLVVERGTVEARTVDVGAFPPKTLERERARRAAAAAARAETRVKPADPMLSS